MVKEPFVTREACILTIQSALITAVRCRRLTLVIVTSFPAIAPAIKKGTCLDPVRNYLVFGTM